MRLAFLADAALPHTVRWVNEFADRGHDCVLLSLERGSGYRCRVHDLPSHSRLPHFARYALEVPRARRLLHDFRPEVVNALFLPNYGWMAARAGVHPLVLSALGSDFLGLPARSPLRRARIRWVLPRCDAVTSDAHTLSAAVQSFGFPADRILTVPFGIEAQRFAPAPPRSEVPLVALSSRRLERVYDVGTLLEAYDLLEDAERARIELRIAGSGSQEAALRRRARELPVRFLGWLSMPQLDAELRRAHLYVSTSRSDSTSVSLLEAMAAGCLPVVSDLPANREWVQDGDNGLLFPCGQAAALVACLRRAAGDPELRRSAARRNREIIARRATWERNLDEVEALFARVAAAAQGLDAGSRRGDLGRA